MKKRMTAFILFLCLLLLCGCAPSVKETQEAPAVKIVATDVPAVSGGASGLAKLMDPYRSVISSAGENAPGTGYLIPQEVFAQAERDFASYGYALEDGFFVCNVNASSVSTYEVGGMNTALATMSPEEKQEDESGDGDMDTTLMGDWTHTGGGTYTREASYALQQDLQGGSMHFHTLLNGVFSGEERFSYLIRNGVLFFCDATLSSTGFDEDGQAVAETWLITCGKIEKNRLNVVEYVSAEAVMYDAADLAALDPDALLSRPGAVQTQVR